MPKILSMKIHHCNACYSSTPRKNYSNCSWFGRVVNTKDMLFHLCYVQIIMSHFWVSKSMMTLGIKALTLHKLQFGSIVMKFCLPYVNSQTMPRNYFDTLVLFVMYCPCVEWLLKVIVVNFNEIYSSHWQEMPILTRVPDLFVRAPRICFSSFAAVFHHKGLRLATCPS